jgi:putative protease
MFGTRQKDDVISAKNVLKDLSHLYDNENPLIPVDFDFVCKVGEPITLVATTDTKNATVSSVVPEKAINKPMTAQMLENRLAKLGGTQYYLRNFTIELDEGLIVPASEINALRRAVIEKLNKQPKTEVTALALDVVPPKRKHATPYYTARFLKPDTIPENHPFKRIFIPIDSSIDDFRRTGAGVEIPRGLFGMEQKLKNRLQELKNAGVTMALCSNIGAYKTAQDMGYDVYGDFGLNIFNSESANQFKSPILSFELTAEQVNNINAPDTGIIAYGKLPLMLTRNCPVKNRIGCARCKKNGTLTDRKGYKFQVICSNYPCVEILNPVPLYLGDRESEFHTDFIHFYFTDETKEQICQLVKLHKNRGKISTNYTRGLYYRGVE